MGTKGTQTPKPKWHREAPGFYTWDGGEWKIVHVPVYEDIGYGMAPQWTAVKTDSDVDPDVLDPQPTLHEAKAAVARAESYDD